MTETQALLEAQRIAVTGTIIAALVGGFFGFLGSWIISSFTVRSERKRQLLQLGFEMGIKRQEQILKIAEKDVAQGKKVSISSPLSFIYRDIRVMELIADGKLSPKNLEKIVNETRQIIDTLRELDKKIKE